MAVGLGQAVSPIDELVDGVLCFTGTDFSLKGSSLGDYQRFRLVGEGFVCRSGATHLPLPTPASIR